MVGLSDLMTRFYPYFIIFLIIIIIFLFFKLRYFIFNRGFILIKKRQYEIAIEEFKQQLQKNPHKGFCYYGLGWCYYMLGFNQHAIRNFELSVEQKFREVESSFLLAILYTEEKKFSKAFEIIEKGKIIQKKKIIFDRLTKFQINEMEGWVYYKRNELKKSLKYYEKAIIGWEKYFKRISAFNLGERFSSVFYRIGIILKIKGEIEKAKEYFENSIKSSPNTIFAEKSKSELEKMTN